MNTLKKHPGVTTDVSAVTFRSFWAAFVHHQLADEDRVFVLDRYGEYTAEQVADHVEVLAPALTDRGVAPGDRVLIQAAPDVSTVVTTLAALRIGAVGCLISAGHGALEMEQLARVLRPSVAVTPVDLRTTPSVSYDRLLEDGLRSSTEIVDHIGAATSLASVALTVVSCAADGIIRAGGSIDPHDVADFLLGLPGVVGAGVVDDPDNSSVSAFAVLTAEAGAAVCTVDHVCQLFNERAINPINSAIPDCLPHSVATHSDWQC